MLNQRNAVINRHYYYDNDKKDAFSTVIWFSHALVAQKYRVSHAVL
jgi:hypothetical protein